MITNERILEELGRVIGDLIVLKNAIGAGAGDSGAGLAVPAVADGRLISVSGAEADVTPLDDPKMWKNGKGFRVWSAMRLLNGRLPMSKGAVMVSGSADECKFEQGATVRVRGDLSSERTEDGAIRRTFWVREILGNSDGVTGADALRAASDARFEHAPKEDWEKAIESKMPEGGDVPF